MRALRALTLAAFIGGSSAAAQDTGPAEPAPLDTIAVQPAGTEPADEPLSSAEPAQLEEIIVTAQKTKQPLHKVPLSVTAVGGDFVQDIGAADLTDVAIYVPNVRVDTDDPGSPQVFIRGFGTNTFNPSFESSVGFVQDEIFFGRGGYFTEAMFDIERIEVLRGPQGTLFGKNAIAGLFNVTSKGPTDTFSGDLRYSMGEHGEQRVEAGVGGMITDWLGVRISGLDYRSDGQLYNQLQERDEENPKQQAGRIKVLLRPLDDLEMELTAVNSETDINFWPYQLLNIDEGTYNFLHSYDADIEDDPYDFRTSFDTPGYINKGSTTAGLKTDWTIGDLGGLQDVHSVLVVGGSRFYIHQLNDLDVSPADLLRLRNEEDYDQTSVELRFTGSADSLFGLGQQVEFVGGLYYFGSNYDLMAQIRAGGDLGSFILTDDFVQLVTGSTAFNLFTSLGLPGIPIIGEVLAPIIGEDYYQYDYNQKLASGAVFGQMTWYLTEHWAITPGLRINREEKTVDTAGTARCTLKDTTGLPVCIVSLVLGANDYDERGLKREETDYSPKIALQYFLDDDVNFYTSYTRGYKSGGYNSLSYTGEDLAFQPEKAQTVELGFKGRFFDRTLNFSTTLYQTKLENLQVLAFNGTFFDVSNAAAARAEGLEAEFQWITPFEPLRINGSFGLLDARYDSYPEAPAPITEGQNQLQDLSGERIAFAPRQTATLSPTLSFYFWNLATRLSVDVIYQGDQYTDSDLDPATHVDAYTQYAARLSLGNQAETWSVTLGGTNLSDELVLNQVTDALLFPGTYYAQQASGRQLFAALSIKW